MAFTEKAEEFYQQMFPGRVSPELKNDREFMERYDNFAFDEVIAHGGIDNKTRFFAIMAVCMGCGGVDQFRIMMKASMNFGVTPEEIRELVYQGVPYLGMARVMPCKKVMTENFKELGIELPLNAAHTTTMENRFEKGLEAQDTLFPGSKKNLEAAPEDTRHMNVWLADNCFGDYYTRKYLDLPTREMLTFCYLYAQGGCEPQLKSHIEANFRQGNDRAYLINIISACINFIGYPRTLNALRCINEVAAESEK